MIGEHVGTMTTGVEHIAHREQEGVDAAVGHHHGAYQVGVDRGLALERQLGVDNLGADAGTQTAVDEELLVSEVVFGQRDEESVVLFDTVGRDASQYLVLHDTLGGALLVGDGIAGTTVQQAVVAAGGAVGEVVALDEQHAQATHATVAGSACACDASTNDNHIVMVFKFHIFHCGKLYAPGRSLGEQREGGRRG